MRARSEHRDAVTGVGTLRPGPGLERSGRYLARIRPRKGSPLVVVEVDEDQLIFGDASYAIHPDAVADLRKKARAVVEQRKDRDAQKRKSRRRLAATYRDAGAAAKQFFAENEDFFDRAVEADPQDYVRDWLAGVDVRRGRSHKRLSETKKGAELLNAFRGDRRGPKSVIGVLRWIFGQNKGRRWAEVPWDVVRSFEDALRETGAELPAVTYPIAAAESTAEELDALGEHNPEEARARALAQNLDRLAEDVDALATAYRKTRKCLDEDQQKAVRRRLRQLRAILRDPERLEGNPTLCETVGFSWLCDFPTLEAEIRRIREGCAMPGAPSPGAPVAGPISGDAPPWEPVPLEGLVAPPEMTPYPEPEPAGEPAPPPWERPQPLPGQQGSLITEEQAGFALVPEQGAPVGLVRPPRSTQAPLFDVGRPDPAVLAERRRAEIEERAARRRGAPAPSEEAPLLADVNPYEQRIEEKRERLEAAAAKARARAQAEHAKSRAIVEGIPMGQPILVGHHSEKRHRRDIAKSHSAMQRAVDLDRRARELERRAEGLGKHSISSDDPDAVRKLGERLAELEEQREKIKAFNRDARRAKKDTLPGYMLSNLGGNIRRVKARIAELEAAKEKARTTVQTWAEFPGGRYRDEPDDNRIRIYFDSKPPEATRNLLKSRGFRWSPRAGAWQRQISEGATYAAKQIAASLRPKAPAPKTLSQPVRERMEREALRLRNTSKDVALTFSQHGIGRVWRVKSPAAEWGERWEYLVGPGDSTSDQVVAVMDEEAIGFGPWIVEQPSATDIFNNPHGVAAMARKKKTAKRKAKKKATRKKIAKKKTTRKKTAKRKAKKKATRKKTAKKKTTRKKTAKRKAAKKKTTRRKPSEAVQRKSLAAALRGAV